MSEKEYDELIGLKDGTENKEENKAKIKKELLKTAFEIRNFEIDKYWQRSSYFTLFISAIFAAYCQDSIECDFILKIMLTVLGLYISYIWYLSTRGAKFWQENWEKHIDYLEGNTDKIYKTVFIKNYNFFNRKMLGSYPISPAKCNTMISLLITIAWGVLFFKEIIQNKHKILDILSKINLPAKSLYAIILIIVIFLPILARLLKTSFIKDIDKKNLSESPEYINVYVRHNKKINLVNDIDEENK